LGGWLVTYRNKCPAPGIEPVTASGTLFAYLCLYHQAV